MARSIRDSDADDVIRSKIPTIRETTDSSIITSASAVFYKQISGTGELELDATNVKFIQITNTHLTLNTYVSLSIKRSVTPAEIFIVKTFHIKRVCIVRLLHAEELIMTPTMNNWATWS